MKGHFELLKWSFNIWQFDKPKNVVFISIQSLHLHKFTYVYTTLQTGVVEASFFFVVFFFLCPQQEDMIICVSSEELDF